MDITTIVQACILGIAEGFTEFIPVSSTGHLIFLIELLNIHTPPGKVFEIVIQLGAILAICFCYRQKLLNVLTTCHRDSRSRHFLVTLLIAFLPAAVLGFYFHDFIKNVLFSPLIVSITLCLGGLAMLIIEKYCHTPRYFNLDTISFTCALKIGLAQAFALIPGVSRSGATIMGGIIFGVERKIATEFSFFLAIPTMFGATIYDIYINYHLLDNDHIMMIAIGFFSAFFAALLVVKKILSFISMHGFAPFAYYRLLLGSIIFLYYILK